MSVSTVHEPEGSTLRRVTVDGEEHDFEIVGEEDDREGYEYQGDDDPPADVEDELSAWIDEHHGGAEGDDWTHEPCGETFDSQQEYAAHFPCPDEEDESR